METLPVIHLLVAVSYFFCTLVPIGFLFYFLVKSLKASQNKLEREMSLLNKNIEKVLSSQ